MVKQSKSISNLAAMSACANLDHLSTIFTSEIPTRSVVNVNITAPQAEDVSSTKDLEQRVAAIETKLGNVMALQQEEGYHMQNRTQNLENQATITETRQDEDANRVQNLEDHMKNFEWQTAFENQALEKRITTIENDLAIAVELQGKEASRMQNLDQQVNTIESCRTTINEAISALQSTRGHDGCVSTLADIHLPLNSPLGQCGRLNDGLTAQEKGLKDICKSTASQVDKLAMKVVDLSWQLGGIKETLAGVVERLTVLEKGQDVTKGNV